MSSIFAICFGSLAVAALLALVRVLRPGSLADRIVGLDFLVVVLVGALALESARTGDGLLLDLLVMTTLLGFLGTVTLSGFLARRGEGR